MLDCNCRRRHALPVHSPGVATRHQQPLHDAFVAVASRREEGRPAVEIRGMYVDARG